MSVKYLGRPFDIHSGGIDLVFPHHENEIAQVEAAYGSAEGFAKYWIHNGHLNILGQKMSKSLNNFLLVRDILKTRTANEIRFFLLSAHYRSPLDWTEENVGSAVKGYTELVHTLARVSALVNMKTLTPDKVVDLSLTEKGKVMEAKFVAAMDDDFNTASAIAALFEYAGEIKNTIKKKDWVMSYENWEALRLAGEKLSALVAVLGFEIKMEKTPAEILALVSEREKARAAKDWAGSDTFRKKIDEAGYVVEDSKYGQLVFRK